MSTPNSGFNNSNDDEDEQWSDALDHIPSPTAAAAPPPPPPPPPPLLPDPKLLETYGHTEEDNDKDEYDDVTDGSAPKKQKTLSSLADATAVGAADNSPAAASLPTAASKKSKKKNNNVWTKSTSRKGKKKSRPSNGAQNSSASGSVRPEGTVLITPIPRFPDKSDDSPESSICLSRVYKAEKVELSEERLSAGSSKGYRMVRATRGVVEGAWYFEIKIVHLGETGHTRLGWTTEKGDLQAPVGYDCHSFGYRDIDGSKVHKALREKYGGEGYKEGDVIGFYINLPDGVLYAPKPPNLVWYKGQRYMYSADGKEEEPKVVPGSEISFFKNGVCQGVAYRDICGSRYYPAASMYTYPNQPNCEVRFNFGPDFEFFPQDFGDRPVPRPMSEVAYYGYDAKVEAPTENGVADKTS